MVKNIHERLKESRTNAGYRSARQFALEHGLVESTYRSHEAGERGIKQADAEKYAEILDIDLYWLLTGESPYKGTVLEGVKHNRPQRQGNTGLSESADQSANGWLGGKFPDTYGKIPVLGYASGSDERTAINWDYDAPIGWVEAPPKLAGVLKASAVIYRGESMRPRYMDEDVLIINRGLQPAKGRDCVFDTKDGGTHVKTYIGADKGFYYFRQYNPEQEIKIARSEVIGIYAVTDRVYL